MFNVDDVVVYETMGVCRIKDIRTEQFPSMEPVQYYILELVYGPKTTIYAPVDNKKLNIRHIMTRKQAQELIASLPEGRIEWIDNDSARKEQYGAILKRGDRTEMAGLIKTLYFKRDQQIASGRKFHMADARIMEEAERVLYEELAQVLEIPTDEVLSYISEKIGNSADNA